MSILTPRHPHHDDDHNDLPIQALQDKTQRVILVVRDKDVIADKESMEEDLQKYISLNTYLDCEDPWFWQKLR